MKMQEFMAAFDRIAQRKAEAGEPPVVTDREIKAATGEMNSVVWATAARCLRRGLITKTADYDYKAHGDGLGTDYYTKPQNQK